MASVSQRRFFCWLADSNHARAQRLESAAPTPPKPIGEIRIEVQAQVRARLTAERTAPPTGIAKNPCYSGGMLPTAAKHRAAPIRAFPVAVIRKSRLVLNTAVARANEPGRQLLTRTTATLRTRPGATILRVVFGKRRAIHHAETAGARFGEANALSFEIAAKATWIGRWRRDAEERTRSDEFARPRFLARSD